MFPRNDHVTTKMGRLPPSPCQACGSDNHWDKECPDWEVYRVRSSSKKDAHSTEKETTEGDKLYQSAYRILLSQRVAASQIDFNRIQSGFESADRKDETCALVAGRIESRRKTGEQYKTTMEEVDDESVVEARAKKKSTIHLLIHEDEVHEDESPLRSKHPTTTPIHNHQTSCEEIEDESWAEHPARPKMSAHVLSNETDVEPTNLAESMDKEANVAFDPNLLTEQGCYRTAQDLPLPLPPLPKELKPIRMTKKRFYPAGESSVGGFSLGCKRMGRKLEQRANRFTSGLVRRHYIDFIRIL